MMQEADNFIDERLLAEMRLARVFGYHTGRIVLEQAKDLERVFGRGGALILSKIIDGSIPIE